MIAKKLPVVFSLAIFLVSCQAVGECELSPEYVALRKEAYDLLNQPYSDCTNSVLNYTHWTEMARCMSDTADDNTFGECEHKTGRIVGSASKLDSKHCEVFRPTANMFQNHLNQLASDRLVSKCKSP